MRTPHLSLVGVEQGELIQIGEPPRAEFVDWRYGPRLPDSHLKRGLWARLLARFLARLPEPPPEGYDPYRLILAAVDQSPWLASPFLDSASSLSYLFSHIPLAPRCPSCTRPLAIQPWEFQRLRLGSETGFQGVIALCAFCGTETVVPMATARPALRLGLGLVTPPTLLRTVSQGAASALDGSGRPRDFILELSRKHPRIGELDVQTRAGLLIALDETAEVEALEAEWKIAEELAAISDGELSDVPGFDVFRKEVLGDDR